MVFCKMIFKGDGFTRPLVSEHKYFLQKTIIYCPWIKSFVSKQPVRCLESSLELPSQLPWGGCLYKVWRPARPGMLHFYLLCVCVSLSLAKTDALRAPDLQGSLPGSDPGPQAASTM